MWLITLITFLNLIEHFVRLIFQPYISSHMFFSCHWHSSHQEVETIPSPYIWLSGLVSTVEVMLCHFWSYVVKLKQLPSGLLECSLLESSQHAVRKPGSPCRETVSQPPHASHLSKPSSKWILQLPADASWTEKSFPHRALPKMKIHKPKKMIVGDFHGGPVVRAPRFHCRGRWFDHWFGN